MGSCRAEPSSPPEAETAWKQIGTWSGHGNQQLETFPIERVTWRVRWETRGGSPSAPGFFHVTANSGDSGRIVAEIAEIQDIRGEDHDVSYITEIPHRYYLVVASSGVDWKVTVEEPIVP